jgi:hypothetical protein
MNVLNVGKNHLVSSRPTYYFRTYTSINLHMFSGTINKGTM